MSYRKFISTKDMSKTDWLEARRAGIGGSDVSAIAGISKYSSAFEIYISKTEPGTEKEDNESMYWGRTLEAVVAEEFAKRAEKKVQKCNYILQSIEYPFMLANVDRLIVGEKAGLECKTGSEYTFSKWTESEIPEDYMLQIQHYMAVTGFDTWYIAVLIGGNKFKWYTIPRDEQMIGSIIALEKDFWENHVMKEIPPVLDGSESATRWVKEQYKLDHQDAKNDKREIELPEILKDIELRAFAKEQLAYYKKEQEGAENRIKALMQDVQYAICENWKIEYKTSETTKFDNDRFKEEQDAIYKQYSYKDTVRRFTIKELKK